MKRSPWQVALDLVRRLPDYRTLVMIELGCGDAGIVESLARDGCQIRGTTFLRRDQDHVRSRQYPHDLQIDLGVDLTKALPYPDKSFDVVLCLEVIEHLEVHSTLIWEIGRILRPGGVLILTTPNIGRVVSRLHFAITGVHLTKERLPTGRDPLDTIGSFHVRCVDFPVTHWLLWQNGLRVEDLVSTEVRAWGYLSALLSPICDLFVQRALQRHQASSDDSTCNVAKWMRTRAYARSEQLCIVARKIRSEIATADIK